MRRIAVAALAALAPLTLAAPSGANTAQQTDTKARTVRVQLMEMMVMPSATRVPAGKVTFVVTNAGKLRHDFVVLRTRTTGMLPMAGAKAKESGLVGRTPEFGPKQTRRLTLTLKPGRYLLICNVGGHYMAGMHVAFRVG